MKYIIPQSRLNELIFKYLDMQDMSVTKYANAIFFAENVGDKYGVLKYDNGYLYILKRFVDKISNMFSLPEEDIEWIISSWVENTFDVKVVWPHVSSDRLLFVY